MKIIDAVCGLGPWQTRDKLLPYKSNEIISTMDYLGIDSALIYSNLAFNGDGLASQGNALITEETGIHKRFMPAFVLVPSPYNNDGNSPADYTNKMRDAGAKAAWLHIGGYICPGAWIWLIGDMVSMCEEKKIPLFIYAQELTPDPIEKLCKNFPHLRLIIAGLTYKDETWLYSLLKKHKEVRTCCGSNYIPTFGPERFVKHFGSERLIFGSGLPRFSPGALIGYIMYSALSDKDKQAILGDNIKKLMEEAQL